MSVEQSRAERPCIEQVNELLGGFGKVLLPTSQGAKVNELLGPMLPLGVEGVRQFIPEILREVQNARTP